MYVDLWVDGDNRAPRRSFGPMPPAQAQEAVGWLREQVAAKGLPLTVSLSDRDEPHPSLNLLAAAMQAEQVKVAWREQRSVNDEIERGWASSVGLRRVATK